MREEAPPPAHVCHYPSAGETREGLFTITQIAEMWIHEGPRCGNCGMTGHLRVTCDWAGPGPPNCSDHYIDDMGRPTGGMAHATNRHWLNPRVVGKRHTYTDTPGEPILPCISDVLSNMPVPRPYGLDDQGEWNARWEYVRDLEGRDLFDSPSHRSPREHTDYYYFPWHAGRPT